MPALRVFVLIVFILALAKPVLAVSQRDIKDCNDKGNQVRVIAACTRLLKEPNISAEGRAKVYVNRAVAYAGKNELDKAIADANEAIRSKPGFANAFWIRGWSYAAKGDNDRAIADYSEAIRFKPDMATAYYNRAISYARKGDESRTMADLKKAAALGHQEAGNLLRKFGKSP